jgi:hypothetical protein
MFSYFKMKFRCFLKEKSDQLTIVNTTAYVASTLPVAVLDKKIAEWGVTKIILQGKTHLASYVYLQQRHPAIKLKVLPASLVLGVIHLTGALLWIKLSHRRLIFFHECCCPVIDVLTILIKPAGDYYPQVTMNSFVKVNSKDVLLTNLQKLFCILRLEKWFDYYRGDLDNNEGYFFVQTAKVYPISITMHTVSESRAILLGDRRVQASCGSDKKILILCGRDVVSDLVLKRIYSQVIEMAISEGFICYLKDHPAKHARLNMIHEDTLIIDSAMPLEFIQDDFSFIVGVASTGLLNFNTRGISIIKLLPAGKEDELMRRSQHLVGIPGGEEVQFPEDLSALQAIFKKLK